MPYDFAIAPHLRSVKFDGILPYLPNSLKPKFKQPSENSDLKKKKIHNAFQSYCKHGLQSLGSPFTYRGVHVYLVFKADLTQHKDCVCKECEDGTQRLSTPKHTKDTYTHVC